MSPRDRPLILVVDDQPINLRVLVTALRDDYDMCVATGGSDALALIADRRPDLVLLDRYMPDIDGVEVLRRVRGAEITRKLPVVIVSADEEADAELLELRPDSYLAKPIDVARLRATVAALLAK